MKTDNALDLSPQSLWQAVSGNDRRYDGVFYYGVTTTKIYCRPQCPSRTPKPANVRFFFSTSAAKRDGFAPCKRCEPDKTVESTFANRKVLEVCRYIEQCERIPTLDELSQACFMSAAHLQRLFRRTLGLSPRDYADAQRQARMKRGLQGGESILASLYGAGYGSTSRVYETAARLLGMTPKAYQRKGRDQVIHYCTVKCPLGWLLVAATEKGLCSVQIGDSKKDLEASLHGEFKNAEFRKGDDALDEWVQILIDYLSGTAPLPPLPYDVQATAFQRRVWDHLRAIPPGNTTHYQQIAEAFGNPNAARAVARACATNPVALVIPCHRVIQKSGNLAGYRWGIERKRRLLEMEKKHPE